MTTNLKTTTVKLQREWARLVQSNEDLETDLNCRESGLTAKVY